MNPRKSTESDRLNMIWALSGIDAEPDLIAAASAGGIVVDRRCFDAPELLAVSAVVPDTHVLVSAGLPRMSSEIMATLHAQVASVTVIAFSDSEEARARLWNADRILRGDQPGFDLVSQLRQNRFIQRVPHERNRDKLGGYVSACWGPVGSHGRTTFAIGLAEALATTGVRVLLIDADTEAPSVAMTLGIDEDISGIVVAARYAEQNALNSRALANCARAINPYFWVMTGLSDPQRWPELRSGAMGKIVARARENFDHIIIDLGAGLQVGDVDASIDLAPTLVPQRTAVTRTVLANADQVYLLTRADAVGAQRLALTYAAHASLFSHAKKCAVVNVVPKSDSQHIQREFGAICGALDPELEVRYLPYDTAATDMVKKASTLGELNHRGALAKAIRVCAVQCSRRCEHVNPITEFRPFVKFLRIFGRHAHATAGSNG